MSFLAFMHGSVRSGESSGVIVTHVNHDSDRGGNDTILTLIAIMTCFVGLSVVSMTCISRRGTHKRRIFRPGQGSTVIAPLLETDIITLMSSKSSS